MQRAIITSFAPPWAMYENGRKPHEAATLAKAAGIGAITSRSRLNATSAAIAPATAIRGTHRWNGSSPVVTCAKTNQA